MPRGLHINNSAAVLQAAIDGRGIALARSVLVHDDLASGRLVRLWPAISHQSELAYYLVYPLAALELARVQALRQWLLQEVSVPA
jgi:LysR family glycine cleavage system transcriptional activator